MDLNSNIEYSDYNFFSSLPTSEKLLFLYDLLCTDYYQSDVNTIPNNPEPDFLLRWYNLVEKTILPDTDSNVLFVGKYVVINSNSSVTLSETITELFEQGYLLQETKLTEGMRYVFHHQLYCKVFYIIGIEDNICLN